ncbi:MAG: type I restriction-modification system subunit M [Clostridiales bacterium]|jgi:type I restriction enzyme M protein|nr:type I restriction-modification system subunit M [Clostridiales bacterium]
MDSRISLEKLKSYFWNSAVLLRTHIDAGAYKQYIFPLLFFKRISDVYDEECEAVMQEYEDEEALLFSESHRFDIPNGSHWRDVRNATEDVGNAITAAFKSIELANSEKLGGIFGEGSWTNKNRLPDKLLKDLIEHFSSLTLSIKNCPEDELGQGYEYLIRQFADDSGHTAQEFYTNRTVVHLMTEMLRPEPGETIYDPTCGSAGMLISAIAHLKSQGKEWRNVKPYGQEINFLTSSIARMNLFLHGVKDFEIANADTLLNPAFIKDGELMTFDMIVANPPYSISQWNRDAFASDKHGRNFLGTPPQGRADYAFLQHILKSLDPNTGRCAILFPLGVLFRNEESSLREKLISLDLVECVIGLGKNLFYNSPMEACIVICRSKKEPRRKGLILLINAVNDVTRKNAQSYLEDSHIKKIADAYSHYEDIEGFAKVIRIDDARQNDFSLSIPLYVRKAPRVEEMDGRSVAEHVTAWQDTAFDAQMALAELNLMLDNINCEQDSSFVQGMGKCVQD